MIGEVEDKYRLDIKNAGGYDNLLLSYFNTNTRDDFESLSEKEKKGKTDCEFYVEVELTDLVIPAIPCKSISIKRSFNYKTQKETVDLLIDGDENELTKQVGYDVFINDFILPREIAKFFFFDAEKIVSLAEARSKAELRNLSKAYSEVLGIKKYEDLKKNLESLLSNLRRRGISKDEELKLDKLVKSVEEIEELINFNQDQQDETDKKLRDLRAKNDALQEKLIREGNQISLEELKELKSRHNWLETKLNLTKAELKRLMEFVPLAIAGNSLANFYEQLQLEKELKNTSTNPLVLKRELEQFSKRFLDKLDVLQLSENQEEQLRKQLKEALNDRQKASSTPIIQNILLDYSDEQFNKFETLYNYLKTTFKDEFNRVVQEEKDYRTLLKNTTKKIKAGEARKDNPLAKQLRLEKELVSKEIQKLQYKGNKLKENFGVLKQQQNSLKMQLSEVEKKSQIIAQDLKKHKVAITLLEKINLVIKRIKEEKRYSLQKAISVGLKKLMHKQDFVIDVKVIIDTDVMDIELLDGSGASINKENLSKGEQQLYATALLNALVEESKVNFPVFIDSPLQKFDKFHAENIIKEFYPTVSDQVVLFPLLEKELSEKEFALLQDNLNSTFLILNDKAGSRFKKITKNKELFESFRKYEDVYQY